MGSKWREPRPKSPERLAIKSIDKTSFTEEDGLEITVTFSYDAWCCRESHELVDAVIAMETSFKESAVRAYKKRMRGAERESREMREYVRKELEKTQDGAVAP